MYIKTKLDIYHEDAREIRSHLYKDNDMEDLLEKPAKEINFEMIQQDMEKFMLKDTWRPAEESQVELAAPRRKAQQSVNSIPSLFHIE